MNQNIINYLKQNKDQYSQEILMAELKKAGHQEKDIREAVDVVYKVGSKSKLKITSIIILLMLIVGASAFYLFGAKSNIFQKLNGYVNNASVKDLDAETNTVNTLKKNVDMQLPIGGPAEIIDIELSENNKIIWGLSMNFDPSNSNGISNYYILKIDKDENVIEYDTLIPVGAVNTPYRAKNQIRFFKLIDNRYLYVGIEHLDGTIYILKFDTKNPEEKHFSMNMQLKGEADASNMFLSKDESIWFVGAENGKAFLLAIDKNKNTILQKENVANFDSKTLKVSKLLNNNYILLAFNAYSGKAAGSSTIILFDEKGVVVKKKDIDGLVTNLFAAGESSVLVMVSEDGKGETMKAKVFDNNLVKKAEFEIPNFFEITDAAGSLRATNKNTLISMLVDRVPGSTELVKVVEYSESGSQVIAEVKNEKPGSIRAYNTSFQVFDNKTLLGVAKMGIADPILGYKSYQIKKLQSPTPDEK